MTNEELLDKLNSSIEPGSFACHEALHMAGFLCDAVSDQLCSHPAIAANPEWLDLAQSAETTLAALYQKIAKVHI